MYIRPSALSFERYLNRNRMFGAIKVEIKSNKEFYSKDYGGDLDELCSNLSIYGTESVI